MKKILICLLTTLFLVSCDFYKTRKFRYDLKKENEWVVFTLPGDSLKGISPYVVKQYITNDCKLTISEGALWIDCPNTFFIKYNICHDTNDNIINDGDNYYGKTYNFKGVITKIKYTKNNKVVDSYNIRGHLDDDGGRTVFFHPYQDSIIINRLSNGYNLNMIIDGFGDDDVVLNIPSFNN